MSEQETSGSTFQPGNSGDGGEEARSGASSSSPSPSIPPPKGAGSGARPPERKKRKGWSPFMLIGCLGCGGLALLVFVFMLVGLALSGGGGAPPEDRLIKHVIEGGSGEKKVALVRISGLILNADARDGSVLDNHCISMHKAANVLDTQLSRWHVSR